jgi:sugar phosphate isomerase/epimerase
LKYKTGMDNRRQFLKQLGAASLGVGLSSFFPSLTLAKASAPALFFDLSLAEFSFATSLYAGTMDHLDFPGKAKKDFGISKVEYVSGFWKEKKPTDQDYLKQLKSRADDNGVRSWLIMVDGAGNLGASEASKRQEAIDNHTSWIEAAKHLGCYAIRVNLDGDGTDEAIASQCVDGYSKLVEVGAKHKIAVLVENHIGPSVNPDWLVNVLRQVKSKYAGALVDTANFKRYKLEAMTLEAYKNAKIIATYDKYEGVKKLMPYAKGVSAKTHTFDKDGNDEETDFVKMMKIIRDSGFKGTIGVEYEGAFLKSMLGLEGNYLSEDDGVRATRALLEKSVEKI